MPFTFSHTAVVIPFLYLPRKWISVTGIIIGSMTPDFEYFLRMRIRSDYSHTLEGMFWFDLPLCLLVAFIFHNLIRNPLINHLPLFLKERFSPYTIFNWNVYFKRNIVVVLISSIVGIASHCLWDSFTHPSGYFVGLLPALQADVSVFRYTFDGCKVLQYVSGLVGAMFIIGLVFYMPRHKSVFEKVNNNYWILFILSLAIITTLRFVVNPTIISVGNLVVTLIAASFISLIIVGCMFSTKRP